MQRRLTQRVRCIVQAVQYEWYEKCSIRRLKGQNTCHFRLWTPEAVRQFNTAASKTTWNGNVCVEMCMCAHTQNHKWNAECKWSNESHNSLCGRWAAEVGQLAGLSEQCSCVNRDNCSGDPACRLKTGIAPRIQYFFQPNRSVPDNTFIYFGDKHTALLGWSFDSRQEKNNRSNVLPDIS